MAEVRKKEKVEKYNIDEIAVKKNKKEEPKKVEKKTKKKVSSMVNLHYITLRQQPALMDTAADWFHSKWAVPKEACLECMEAYLKEEKLSLNQNG